MTADDLVELRKEAQALHAKATDLFRLHTDERISRSLMTALDCLNEALWHLEVAEGVTRAKS